MADTLKLARLDLTRLKLKREAHRRNEAPYFVLEGLDIKIEYLKNMVESLQTMEKLRQHLMKGE